MEHPLQTRPSHRRDYLALARALLYADSTTAAHLAILTTCFSTKPRPQTLKRLAAHTVSWTSTQPRPRLRAFEQKLLSHAPLRRLIDEHGLSPTPLVPTPARMRPFPAASTHLPLNNTRDLADWLRLDPEHLLWFADLQNRNAAAPVSLLSHYTTRLLAKPYGSIRLLEVPRQRLRSIQRQILTEILEPVPLHPAVHGFRKGRSILTFAAPHAARAAVLRLDLEDFFPSITGPRVQALFRTLGYPEPVADLLGGLSTTTTPRRTWRNTGLELNPKISGAPALSTPVRIFRRAHPPHPPSRISAPSASTAGSTPSPKPPAPPTPVTPTT